MVPVEEQIENSSLYYEKSIKTWFLFTNHIGVEEGREFTDAIWVYWSKNLNQLDRYFLEILKHLVIKKMLLSVFKWLLIC